MTIKTMRSLMAAVAILAPACAQAGPILEFGSGVIETATSLSSSGWSFTTGNASIRVGALDAYLNGETFTNVRLSKAGITLASANVTTSDTLEGSPIVFHSHALAIPLTLAPNTTYFIAMDIAASAKIYAFSSGLTTDPSIIYDGGVNAVGAGLNPTTDLNSGAINPAYFGPNFDLATAGIVPEPSSILLCGTGLAGLAAFARSRAKRLTT